VSGAARSGSEFFAGPEAALATLASLVLKERVLLGGLPLAHQAAALGLAWRAMPEGVALRESEVNAVLKRCLEEACRFLAVDHVELRRWLVDTGWLERDGFGREYRRVAPSDLAGEYAGVVAALSAIDPPSWAAGIREADVADRHARRQAWEARQSAPTREAEQWPSGPPSKGPA
jgi:hypothetical protein